MESVTAPELGETSVNSTHRPLTLIPVFLIILFLLAVGWFAWQKGLIALPSFLRLQTGPSLAQLTPDQKRLAMEMSVKSSFNSLQDKDIITYVNLAAAEKDQIKSYDYYSKAFAKMVISYQKAKNPQQKQALVELKNYVSSLPTYKEGDFNLPK